MLGSGGLAFGTPSKEVAGGLQFDCSADFLAQKFFGLVRGGSPLFSGRAPETPETPRGGLGWPPGAPGARSTNLKTLPFAGPYCERLRLITLPDEFQRGSKPLSHPKLTTNIATPTQRTNTTI